MELYFQFEDVDWGDPYEPSQVFLRDLKPFMHQLVEGYAPLFISERIEYAHRALKEVAPEFERLEEAIQPKYIAPYHFVRYGMSEGQAEFKFGNIRHWFRRFWEALKKGRDWVRGEGARNIAKLLSSLLSSIDVVLDSLLSLVGGSDALKEFKDSLKNVIDNLH